jgi:Rod binding domain-containing protein
MNVLNSVGSSLSSNIPDPSKAKTQDAAEQFEALLIASMLQSCRQGSSWMGSGEESGGQSAVGYAEEHLARALAAQGGFGIAATVMKGLEPSQNLPYATATAGSEMPASTAGATSSAKR